VAVSPADGAAPTAHRGDVQRFRQPTWPEEAREELRIGTSPKVPTSPAASSVRNASTTSLSNWLPDQIRSCSRASSTERGSL
jgi:hypothetical protein